MTDDQRYTAKLFINCVLPLVKIVAAETPLKRAWKGKNGVVQLCVDTDEGPWGIHYLVDDGELNVKLGTTPIADVTLKFKDVVHLNAFFKNQTKKLPKISGIKNVGLLTVTFRTLIKMGDLLGVTEAPADEATKRLVTKMMFYLLTSGISQLNKQGHPDVSKWAKKSPNRVYMLEVENDPELAAFLRLKAGKSKASRGVYTRSKPFFTMKFADVDSALAILLGTGDLLALTAEHKLIMEGAPEFGAKLGDFMELVGAYTQ